MIKKSSLTAPVPDATEYGNTLFATSVKVLIDSQFESGGTGASLKGTRYAGHCYPRDHGYATRAFIAAGLKEFAEKALSYILTCELSDNNIMYQRYNLSKKSASYKPPQIDGNAQTILAATRYLDTENIPEIVMKYSSQLNKLTKGILKQTHNFTNGSLVEGINGIIEFPPFEQGFDLYTNAVSYRALKNISQHPEILGDALAKNAEDTAQNIQKGIMSYLRFKEKDTFFTGIRREPSVSEIKIPFPKNYLALSDFEVFEDSQGKEMVKRGLTYHLEGTKNEELGGFNRYHELMGRHNFGNGPWPMMMLRLAQHYIQSNEHSKAKECFNWVMNVAKNNKDKPGQLPEHVSTKEAFTSARDTFTRLDETAPRPAKGQEYTLINNSKTMQEDGIAYAVNPLVWSHSQFILAWTDYTADTPVHNY